MPTAHLPPGHVARNVFAMQVEAAAAGVRSFGSYDRAIYFAIVLRQAMRLRIDPASTPNISIHSVSTTFMRPYATVWRHIQALAAAGHVTVYARRVSVDATALDEPAVALFIARLGDAFTRLGDRLGLSSATPGDTPTEHHLVAAIDLLLCVIDQHGGLEWDAALMLGCLRHLEEDPAPHAPLGAPSGKGTSISELSRLLNRPYATVRRLLRVLVADAVVAEPVRGGFGMPHRQATAIDYVMQDAACACAQKVFARSYENQNALA